VKCSAASGSRCHWFRTWLKGQCVATNAWFQCSVGVKRCWFVFRFCIRVRRNYVPVKYLFLTIVTHLSFFLNARAAPAVRYQGVSVAHRSRNRYRRQGMMNDPNRCTAQAKSNSPTDPLGEALHLDRMSPEFLHLLQLRHVLFGGVLAHELC
jgi:hypothetical protein